VPELRKDALMRVRVIESSNVAAVDALLDRARGCDRTIERRAARIVADVRKRGDAAVLEYARTLDGLEDAIEVPASEVRRAARAVPADLRSAIALAARHIRVVAERQVPKGWRISPSRGVSVEQRITPLHRVGCYVPGGRYPLPSTLLMTAVPARAAGVQEIVVTCPRPDAAVLAAALEAGVDRMFRVGGAHAVAALAYGTRRIPQVDKIVGPGNAYVAAAKALVSRDCAIDFNAGPSEIVIVSSTGDPHWIAADLVAQAEHDPHARAILLTPSKALALAVQGASALQVPGGTVAGAALAKNGAIILTRNINEAITICQRIAPEHAMCDNDRVAAKLTTAGTVFVGRFSAQALGDYATGSNHVLPTNGAARARGGLSAADFVRISSVQRVSRSGLAAIGTAAALLADAEGLIAHAASIRLRQSAAGATR
jgi:histidinol dehydrogenase